MACGLHPSDSGPYVLLGDLVRAFVVNKMLRDFGVSVSPIRALVNWRKPIHSGSRTNAAHLLQSRGMLDYSVRRGKEFHMKAITSLILGVVSACLVFAQNPNGHATVLVPDSSKEAPADRGVAAHTNHLVLVHPAFTGTAPAGETPQSISPVYNLTFTGTGGSNVIAIVD